LIGRLGRKLRLALAFGLIASLVLGAIGQVVRDRSIGLALLLYSPLVLFGLAAVGVDAVCRGRALPIGRFVLGTLGALGFLLGAWPMLGFGPEADPGGHNAPISVLHWNVVWGGGRSRNPKRWLEIRREILERRADLIVLSEAPPDDWLDMLVEDLGPGTTRVQLENPPGAGYWYKLVVLSRFPLRSLPSQRLTNGAGMAVEAELPGRKLRPFVVDGQSHPLLPRLPFLGDVAGACRRASAAGEPFDLVLGDFNALDRNLGCEALVAQGYQLASRSSRGWRGTFPAICPVYDIDHVWVHPSCPLLGDELFTQLASDHRGQLVRFRAE
jgi:endonuclease/exonuclease/phosphatase family metal-dependent hydrolase